MATATMILIQTSAGEKDETRPTLGGYIAALSQELRRALAASQCFDELSRRSPAQLADMGLARADIASSVRRQHFE